MTGPTGTEPERGPRHGPDDRSGGGPAGEPNEGAAQLRGRPSAVRPADPRLDPNNPRLDPADRRRGPDDPAGEAGRPLLMDPAGARPTGFAAPAALSDPVVDAPTSPAGRAGGAPDTRRARAATGAATPPAVRASSSPWAPGSSTAAVRPGRPNTRSVLAGPTPGVDSVPAAVPAAEPVAGPASSFGPVSRVVTVSIRTPSSRIDLALPDRTSIAEVLEIVLDVAPRSLREQAMAHGGWILRTAAGRPLPGATTLLDEGIAGGSTLFLAGADTAETAVVYDDVADAVADAVRADNPAWPAAAGRACALGATAAGAILAVLAVVALGPPWTVPAMVLAGLAVGLQAVAALVARRVGDLGLAVTIGLVSVAAGAAAAVTAAAGSRPLAGLGPLPWLLGALTAAVLAGTATLAIGSRRVPFGAITTGAALLAVALAGDAAFDLGPLGTAAIIGGLALCVMPALPALSLRLAAFEPDPLPTAAPEIAAIRRPVDARDVRQRTGRAVNLLTSLLQGLAWPALAAGVVLAFGDRPAGQALAAVVGLALLLRGRLFPTLGQRLPLVLAGIGCLLAVPTAIGVHATSATTVIAVGITAGVAAAASATIAARREPRTPAMARAAEIIDLVLTIAVIPLVAAVLGAFAFARGLGG
ncbi:MAG TPA: type VII secretion integral membrane protein EccD [Nakamurella sp.]